MIEVTVVGNWALVVLAGEFDISNAEEIRSVAVDLTGQLVTELTVDLSGVTFIGAAGINALIAADALVSAAGGRTVMVGASPVTRRVLTLAGVADSLPVVKPAAPSGAALRSARTEAPVGDDELSGLLAEVSRRLLTDVTVTGDLRAVVRTALELVPGCSAASVALIALGRSRSAAVSDQVAVQVDLAQYETDEGPCLDAASTSGRIRVDVLADDGRFSRFARLAADLGVGSVLSTPVVMGGATVGTLNLYSSTSWQPGAEATGMVIAAQVAAALAKSDIYTAALALAQRVQQRTDDDREVNIAAGVLAGFEQCSIEQGERLLRSAALTTGESLVASAQRVIGHLSQPASPAG